MSIKNWFLISSFFYFIPVFFGGMTLLPKFLWNLRNPLYLSVAIFLIFLTSKSFRKEVSLFYNDPKSFMPSLNVPKAIKVISFLYLFIYIKLVIVNYLTFQVIDVDFSYFDLMISNFTKGKGWYSEACDCIQFGVHSTYIFYILAPLHYLIKSPLFLVCLHAIVLWSAVIPLKKIIAKRKLAPIFNLILIFAFFNYSAIVHILKYNFHNEVFYVPFFLWIFHFLEDKKWGRFYFMALLILTVKEDSGFYLIGLSAAMFFLYSRFHAVFLFVLSSIVTIISIKYVIPYFRSSEEYVFVASALKYGSSMSDAVLNMLKNPHLVIKDVFLGHWLRFLIPSFFITLFDPLFLVTNLPYIIIHSTAQSPLMFSLMLYYSAPYVPFIWISFVRWLNNEFTTFAVFKKVSNFKPQVITFFFLYSSLVGSGFITFRPLKSDIYAFQKVYDFIPIGSSVCAQGSIMPHFGYDFKIGPLPKCLNSGFQYVVLNKEINHYPYPKNQLSNIIKSYRSNPKYEEVRFDNFYVFSMKSVL